MSQSSILDLENAMIDRYNGFDLRVEDLIVWMPEVKKFKTHTPKKAILKGVNTEFRKGTLTAIVGPSGSGKTTLLNFLAGRQDNSQMFRTYCNYYLNGAQITNVNQFKNIIGYVLQEDILEARNTPRQIFEYYAKLRGYKDPKRECERVVQAMYLQKCQDTIVGDIFHRGLSGGEKKRTSIGVELVSKPNLLFLDEPTTGLDSTTALDIIMNINELKKQDMTIICTIHQPSEEIMALFDKVIMLVDGQLVYDDSPTNLLSRLSEIGLQKNRFETPIEFFMKSVDRDEVKIYLIERHLPSSDEDVLDLYQKRIKQLSIIQDRESRNKLRTINATTENKYEDLEALAATKNQYIPFPSQFAILFSNYSRLFFTDFRGVVIKSVMFWLIFCLVIIVFIKTPSAEEDPVAAIQNMAGLLFMISTNFFMAGVSAAATVILPAKPLFKKDSQSRFYKSQVFFSAMSAHIIPFYVINITAVSFAFFFLFKFNFSDHINLLWFWAYLVTVNLTGQSLGLVASAVAEKFDDLGAINPILIIPMMMSSGFFANIFTITWPLRIFSYVSGFRFAFQGLILNHFTDAEPYLRNCRVKTQCLDNQSLNCVYTPPVGTSMAQMCDPFVRFNFEQKSVWLNFVILVVLTIGWRIIAFIIFLWRYRERDTKYSTDPELISLYAERLREAKADDLPPSAIVQTQGDRAEMEYQRDKLAKHLIDLQVQQPNEVQWIQ